MAWIWLLLLAPQVPEGLMGIAVLRLEGPLEGAWIEAGGPRTRVGLRLGPGEVRFVPVPVESSALGRPGVPGPEDLTVATLPEAPGRGSARIVSWDAELAPSPRVAVDESLAGIASLPALERLARRTRAPLAATRAGASPVDLALLGALLLAGLALRRRPWVALSLGTGGAVLLWFLPPSDPAPIEVWVLEGDLGAGAWIEVRSALERLALEPGALALPTVRPAGCPRSYEVELEGSGPPRWWARAPGCELSLARALASPALDLEHNGLGRLDPLWIRTADGLWERRAAWEPGLPLPAAAGPDPRADAGPPAWLAAALPQGRAVLVAGLGTGARAPRGQRWVRILGP